MPLLVRPGEGAVLAHSGRVQADPLGWSFLTVIIQLFQTRPHILSILQSAVLRRQHQTKAKRTVVNIEHLLDVLRAPHSRCGWERLKWVRRNKNLELPHWGSLVWDHEFIRTYDSSQVVFGGSTEGVGLSESWTDGRAGIFWSWVRWKDNGGPGFEDTDKEQRNDDLRGQSGYGRKTGAGGGCIRGGDK